MIDHNDPQFKFEYIVKEFISDVLNDTTNNYFLAAAHAAKTYQLYWGNFETANGITSVGIFAQRLQAGEALNLTRHDRRYIDKLANAIENNNLRLREDIVQHYREDYEMMLLHQFDHEDLRFEFKLLGTFPGTYKAQMAQKARELAASQSAAGTGS